MMNSHSIHLEGILIRIGMPFEYSNNYMVQRGVYIGLPF